MADPATESLISKLMAEWKPNQWCTCLGHGPKCHENPRDFFFFFFFLHSTDFFKIQPGVSMSYSCPAGVLSLVVQLKED